jgi:hypothetical protein
MLSFVLGCCCRKIATNRGPPWSRSYGSWIYNYLCHQCLSSLMLWVRISIKTRCTILYGKVCQWLALGRWFSPGPPVSSTNKTDRHDIAEILLKVVLTPLNKQTNKETNQYPIENRWKRHNQYSLDITKWPPTLRVRYRHCSAKLPGLIW